MSTSTEPFSTVSFEDGTFAVVRTDPRKPRYFEVIAIFSDVSRARSYAEMENSRFGEQPIAATEAPQRHIVEPAEVIAELSARQSAVLEALRARMDDNGQVAARSAVLAEAAQIPLGSLHSILQSLVKKGLIKTTRAGSARAPALYQVL